MYKIILFLLICSMFTWADNLVSITPDIHHFGVIKDSESVDAQFHFTNQSTKTMEILDIKTFCGCTLIEPDSRLLSPGESTNLTVNFNPKGKEDFLTWEIHILTNLQQAPFALKFDATVLRDSHLSDDILSFGEFRQGKEQERIIWLSPADFPEFVIDKIELSIDDAKKKGFVSLRYGMGTYEKLYPGTRKAAWAKIIMSEKLPFGKITGNLSFSTNIPGKEYIQIPLFGKVASDVSLSRDHVSMGLLSKDKVISRNIMVYPTEETEHVQVTKVESDLDFLQATLHPIIENQYYEIKVTSSLSGNEKRGEFRGTVTIHTNREQQLTISVPVQGFIR